MLDIRSRDPPRPRSILPAQVLFGGVLSSPRPARRRWTPLTVPSVQVVFGGVLSSPDLPVGAGRP